MVLSFYATTHSRGMFHQAGGIFSLLFLLVMTAAAVAVLFIKPKPVSQTKMDRLFYLRVNLFMLAVTVAATIFSLQAGEVLISGACIIAALMFLGFSAQFIRVSAKDSKSNLLRALERIRSYIANEPASFDNSQNPEPPA